jgi:hypothetical protein
MHLTRLTTIAATALILALGSATPGFAAKKKTAAAPAPQPYAPFCIQPSQPVCGVKGGEKFTYANPCLAEKDGAKIASQGACKAAKTAMKRPKAAKKK